MMPKCPICESTLIKNTKYYNGIPQILYTCPCGYDSRKGFWYSASTAVHQDDMTNRTVIRR